MRRPEDHVDGSRLDPGHLRHRLDGRLVALSGPDEAEAEDHGPKLEPERRLYGIGLDQGQIRDTVGNDVESAFVEAVGLAKDTCRGPGHHDGCGGCGDQVHEDATLSGRWALRNGVQRRHDRLSEGLDEVQHMLAVGSAPDPVFVLHGNGIDVRAVDRAGHAEVILEFIPPDPEGDLSRVGIGIAGVMKRGDASAPDGARKVGGERRYSAAAWGIRGDEGGFRDTDSCPRERRGRTSSGRSAEKAADDRRPGRRRRRDPVNPTSYECACSRGRTAAWSTVAP